MSYTSYCIVVDIIILTCFKYMRIVHILSQIWLIQNECPSLTFHTVTKLTHLPLSRGVTKLPHPPLLHCHTITPHFPCHTLSQNTPPSFVTITKLPHFPVSHTIKKLPNPPLSLCHKIPHPPLSLSQNCSTFTCHTLSKHYPTLPCYCHKITPPSFVTELPHPSLVTLTQLHHPSLVTLTVTSPFPCHSHTITSSFPCHSHTVTLPFPCHSHTITLSFPCHTLSLPSLHADRVTHHYLSSSALYSNSPLSIFYHSSQ